MAWCDLLSFVRCFRNLFFFDTCFLCHVLSGYLNKCFCMISWFHVSLYVAFPFLANLNRGS